VSNFKTRIRIPFIIGSSVFRHTVVRCVSLYLFSFVLCATVHVRQSGFQPAENGLPAGWKAWSARSETAPKTFVDTVHYRTGPGALAISGDSNSLVYGGWHYAIPNVEGGKWYRFAAYYRTDGIPDEPLQVIARLWWTRADGKRSGAPDYPYTVSREGEWTRLSLDAQAPDKTAAMTIHLYLANAPQGTLWWDDISLDEIPAPLARPVTIASIHLRPRDTGEPEESVRRFLEFVEKAVPAKTDVILLPEVITLVGTNKKAMEVAEPIPGATTGRLVELARRRNSYVAASIYEKDGRAIYNTAVLIGRKGEIVGKYRKVYLPYDEPDDGVTPGSDYPVFQTDFGKVGMMTCWDSAFADPARALALKGAEIILMPIWDGLQTLVKARGMENGVFLVTSSYGDPSLIQDPKGEILASATEQASAAVATIDLNRRYDWGYNLGNMRLRYQKELRLDVPAIRPEFAR
jgi:predicted amidohydrolase